MILAKENSNGVRETEQGKNPKEISKLNLVRFKLFATNHSRFIQPAVNHFL